MAVKWLIALPVLLAGGFISYSWFIPWDMGYCGESAIGFYRLRVVDLQWVDYSDGLYQILRDLGGVRDFLSYLFGRFDPCSAP